MNLYDDVPDTTVPLPALSSHWAGPGPVISALDDTACPICEKPAAWLIGGRDRACAKHVGYVLDYVYAALNGLDYRPAVVPVWDVS